LILDAAKMDRPTGRRRWTRHKIAALVSFALALIACLALLAPAARRWARAERVVDAERLRIAEVTEGDLERDVALQGRVVAALHPTLYSPTQGIVTLLARPGAEVAKGQPLARIDSPELASRLAQERATLLSLRSELGRQQIAARQAAVRAKQVSDVLALRLEAATRALRRATEMNEQGVLSRTEHEKANDEVELASLEVKNARETAELEKEALAFEERNRKLHVQRQEAVVAELERQVAQLRVDAPFDGMVASMSVQDRDAVVRNQPLLSVVNLTTFELEVELPEGHAADVTPGTRAEVKIQGKLHPARVTSVSPEVQSGQVRATVAFEGESPAGLRQSERLATRLVLERRRSVLKLPRGPFLESGGGRQAYVVEGGVAVLRAVTVGATSVSEVEITFGLRAGERVIVSDTSVFEGARTILIRE
jgi:HlyD family secretion protein